MEEDMKYIILDKLIYGLSAEDYHLLNILEITYRHESIKASEKEDPMIAYDSYNDLNNFLNWIRQNIEPISGIRDNFDLLRYDRKCERAHKDDDENLPF